MLLSRTLCATLFTLCSLSAFAQDGGDRTQVRSVDHAQAYQASRADQSNASTAVVSGAPKAPAKDC